jgi:endonuclease III
MTISERYHGVLSYFQKHVPSAETELHYTNPYELTIAVILSAQCTDKRINIVTPALFKAFPAPEILAAASVEEIFEYIKSISFPNNKAKHLKGMATMLLEQFNGKVPEAIEDLVKLPGVGRKTANVVASVVYNKPTMAVDTHVYRVSNRLGLIKNVTNPLQAEKQLIKYIPENLVHVAHHWLILHGRYTCLSRQPKCQTCGITEYCYFFNLKSKKLKSEKLESSKVGGKSSRSKKMKGN